MRSLDERQMNRVFDLLVDDEARAETLSELDTHLVSDLLDDRDMLTFVPVFAAMGADDQADLLSVLGDDKQKILMDALRPAEAVEVEGLMTYEPDTAGGIMSPEYFALPSHTTAAEAIAALQRSGRCGDGVLRIRDK